jgi:hypothetical protein
MHRSAKKGGKERSRDDAMSRMKSIVEGKVSCLEPRLRGME